MRLGRILFVSSIFVLMLFAVSCSKKEKLEVNTGLAARVGNSKITMRQLEKRYDELLPSQKAEYEGDYGKAKLLDQMIDEELVYQEALKKHLDKDEDVREKIKDAEKKILMGEFYRKEVVHKIKIPEDEIVNYYKNHKDEFMTKTLLRAQHIFTTDSLKAVEWKKRLSKGENFTRLATKESEDKVAALASGSLGYFNPDGYIKSVGISKTFGEAVEKLKVGQISDIIHWEKGYSIVKLNEKKPGMLKPLSEVRKQIKEKLRSRKASAAYKAELEKLRKEYKPQNFVREKIINSTRTPEELWQMAQMEDDPNKKIEFYLKLASIYPDHKYAPEALFMVGFIYSEDIKDIVQARRVFDRLIERYPDAEITKSARWMIKNMNKPHPKFDSFEQMKKSMSKESK